MLSVGFWLSRDCPPNSLQRFALGRVTCFRGIFAQSTYFREIVPPPQRASRRECQLFRPPPDWDGVGQKTLTLCCVMSQEIFKVVWTQLGNRTHFWVQHGMTRFCGLDVFVSCHQCFVYAKARPVPQCVHTALNKTWRNRMERVLSIVATRRTCNREAPIRFSMSPCAGVFFLPPPKRN